MRSGEKDTSFPEEIVRNVEIHWDAGIALHDGVRLSATLYLPKPQMSPAPCVFTMTPYIAQTFHETGMYFAAHGMPFLAVDVRGRGNSEGVFKPNINEGRDGADVASWIVKQSFSDGQVAMIGGSYGGLAQWNTAKERPNGLATIIPVASPLIGLDFPMRKNVFSPYIIQWLTLVAGRTSQDRLFWDNERFWGERFREWFESGAPFKNVDTMLGLPSSTFQEWIAHPHAGKYWDAHNPTEQQYESIGLPILTITGIYDGDQPGALAHYRNHLKSRSGTKTTDHYLVIGPWDHAGTRSPQLNFAGLKVGPASLLDLTDLQLQWMRWIMQGGPRPPFLKNRVAYYVIGADTWRYAASLEETTSRSIRLHLDADTNPTDLYRSGQLSKDAPRELREDHYVYDPADVSAASIEAHVDPESRTDQRMVHLGTGKQLVYHSDAFEVDTEITGFFAFDAWISIDQPDTDFKVSIYRVDIDGSSTLLTSDWLRARYAVRPQGALITDSAPRLYRFQDFPFAAWLCRRGARLRLVFGPINSIFSEKNYNTGGIVAEESRQDSRPVRVKLLHGADYCSTLIVPLGRSRGDDEVVYP